MNHVHYPPVTYPASRASILAVLVLASGCEDPPRPWSAPPGDRRQEERGPFLPGEGAPSLLGDAGFLDPPEADEEPPASPAPRVGGLWVRCYDGFRSGGDPAADVTRLGMICGPANGMRRSGGLRRGEVRPERPAVFEVAVSGACHRLFISGEPLVGALSVAVRLPGGNTLAEHEGAGALVVEPARPFCTPEDKLVISVSAERRGRVAAEIWSLPAP